MSNRPRRMRRAPNPRDYILPMQPVGGDPIPTDASGYVMADVITVRPGRDPSWPDNVTGLMIDFDVMQPDGSKRVAQVMFVATDEHMRATGHIVASAATMAADACPE